MEKTIIWYIYIYLGKDEATRKDRYTTRRSFKTRKEPYFVKLRLKLK